MNHPRRRSLLSHTRSLLSHTRSLLRSERTAPPSTRSLLRSERTAPPLGGADDGVRDTGRGAADAVIHRRAVDELSTRSLLRSERMAPPLGGADDGVRDTGRGAADVVIHRGAVDECGHMHRRAVDECGRIHRGAMHERRAGHSLTELMVVITLVGLALSGVSTTFATLVRVDRGMREQQQRSERWGQLAYRFRGDVRAAVSAEAAPAATDASPTRATALKLDLGQGRTIEYRGESRRVERIVRDGDQVVHRDSFHLGRSQTATFQRFERAGRAVWVLAVTTDAEQGGQYEGTSRIEATLGTHAGARAGRSRRKRRGAARRNARRGTILAVALIGFLVVALFAAAVTYRVALSARQVRSSRFAAQAEWLVESGAQRAKAQLAASPEYAGETWTVEANEFGAADSGRSGAVVIAVTRDAGESAPRRVLVTASYPADSPLVVRRQLEFNWRPADPTKPDNE